MPGSASPPSIHKRSHSISRVSTRTASNPRPSSSGSKQHSPVSSHHHGQFEFEFMPHSSEIARFASGQQAEAVTLGFDFSRDDMPGLDAAPPDSPLIEAPKREDLTGFELPWDNFESHDRTEETVEEMYARALRASAGLSRRKEPLHQGIVRADDTTAEASGSATSGSADQSSLSDQSGDQMPSTKKMSGIRQRLGLRRHLK